MKWLILIGIVMAGVSIGALYFSDKIWYLLLMFTIAGIGIGLSLPCLDSLITEGVEKEERGTITSIYSSMRFIGVAVGPPVIALLMKFSNIWIFVLLGGVCVISAFVTIRQIRPTNKKHPKNF